MKSTEIMTKFIETNHYQSPDGSEFTDITQCEDETAEGIPFIGKLPSHPYANICKLEMPPDWNHELTMSAIVKVDSSEIDPDSVCSTSALCDKAGIKEKFTSFKILGRGMSPTFSFFPIEIYTESFPVESLDEMRDLYKPGTIFVAEGDYGFFTPHTDTIVIFQANIKCLPQDTAAILDKNFLHDESRT